jgi:hypothetical protein
MPDLSEDDMIDELLLPEVVTLMIMDDIHRDDMSEKECRTLAEEIRQESETHGELVFTNAVQDWYGSPWSKGEATAIAKGILI